MRLFTLYQLSCQPNNLTASPFITVKEAIATYTIHSAWLDHKEDVKGSVEAGKLADFCVIDNDILTIDPHKIVDINILMTVAGGEIVYDSGDL